MLWKAKMFLARCMEDRIQELPEFQELQNGRSPSGLWKAIHPLQLRWSS